MFTLNVVPVSGSRVRLRFTRWGLLVKALIVVCGYAPVSHATSTPPLLMIGSATVNVGVSASATIPVTVSGLVGPVSGLDLRLELISDVEAPPATVNFSTGKNSQDWYNLTDQADPLHFVLINNVAISGPAELANITVKFQPVQLYSTVYTLRVKSATISDDRGRERDVTGQSQSGSVGTPVVYGDLTRNGVVDALDLNRAIQLFLGVSVATTGELRAGDVRPKPGTGSAVFGDGAFNSVDMNWIFRRFLGLETAP